MWIQSTHTIVRGMWHCCQTLWIILDNLNPRNAVGAHGMGGQREDGLKQAVPSSLCVGLGPYGKQLATLPLGRHRAAVIARLASAGTLTGPRCYRHGARGEGLKAPARKVNRCLWQATGALMAIHLSLFHQTTRPAWAALQSLMCICH